MFNRDPVRTRKKRVNVLRTYEKLPPNKRTSCLISPSELHDSGRITRHNIHTPFLRRPLLSPPHITPRRLPTSTDIANFDMPRPPLACRILHTLVHVNHALIVRRLKSQPTLECRRKRGFHFPVRRACRQEEGGVDRLCED